MLNGCIKHKSFPQLQSYDMTCYAIIGIADWYISLYLFAVLFYVAELLNVLSQLLDHGWAWAPQQSWKAAL
jgi:hypothetical protein